MKIPPLPPFSEFSTGYSSLLRPDDRASMAQLLGDPALTAWRQNARYDRMRNSVSDSRVYRLE